jgi:hypothetical protein
MEHSQSGPAVTIPVEKRTERAKYFIMIGYSRDDDEDTKRGSD